ncbi:MAG TPA: hypothetical protein VF761_15875 [Gemmatimonadaceae bacterium]
MEGSRSARRAALSAGAMLAAALMLAPAPARAQERVLVQGVLDLEGWSTDSGSRLLAKHEGRSAALARLCVWSAIEPVSGLVLYLQAEGEGGSAADEASVGIEQAGVRWTQSRAFVVDAGMIAPIVGMYPNRHLSTRNPLVGSPDAYAVEYPLGVRISGKTTKADYRVGLVSLPVSNERYMPSPTAAPHVAAGLGLTPAPWIRVGLSGETGPYMNRELGAALAGRPWESYRQRVGAADLSLSAGYLELRAEGSRSWYDVPGHTRMLTGSAWYGEGVYTWTPRLYTAIRVERNDYPFLKPFGTVWPARMARVDDAELGVGYRVGASQTLKVTYRRDRWKVSPATPVAFPDGHAVAVQLSAGFDLLDALARTRGR